MSYTRCQDRICPMQANCMRYDARYMPEPKQAYFAQSPRNKDQCAYYAPFDHTAKPAPLTSDWPKDDQ